MTAGSVRAYCFRTFTAVLALLSAAGSEEAVTAAAAAAISNQKLPSSAFRGLLAPVAPQEQPLRDNIAADVAALQKDVWAFWAKHGLDPVYGGFHGTLDRRGSPISPDYKGLVQQTRHTWSFSAFHRAGVGTSTDGRTGLPRSQALANSAYKFVAEHMKDGADNLYFWAVSRDGKTVVSRNKSIYGQAFVIYAFSYYYGTFGDNAAKQLALDCFNAMDKKWHNSDTGGYNELWSNSDRYAFDPSATKKQDYQMPRTVNVMLHIIEGLLALHKVSQDAKVLKRLLELMDIFCSRLQLVNGHLVSDYLPGGPGSSQWPAAAGGIVSYGHNLEAAWLLVDAADYLAYVGAIDRATRVSYYKRLMTVAESALRDGYDQVHGGVYEKGLPNTGPTSRVKVWWVQDEAMLAMWKLFKYYNNNVSFLRQLATTSWFVRLTLVDREFGGVFWQVSDDGNHNIQYEPGPDVKGNVWKASYHDTRAVLSLARWLKQP